MSSIPERVNAFITANVGAYCDRCIQEDLAIGQNNQVQQITSTLATTHDFVRARAICAGCGKAKMVTRHAARLLDDAGP